MTTFLVIGIVGLALVGVSLVVGDIFDGAFDALGGDVFSSAVIGGFVSAFGFGAAAVQGQRYAGRPLGTGRDRRRRAVGWLAWWLTRLVKDGGSDCTLDGDTIGRAGRVHHQHPRATGSASSASSSAATAMRLNASADAPDRAGRQVHVTSVLSPTAVTVAPVWNELVLTNRRTGPNLTKEKLDGLSSPRRRRWPRRPRSCCWCCSSPAATRWPGPTRRTSSPAARARRCSTRRPGR